VTRLVALVVGRRPQGALAGRPDGCQSLHRHVGAAEWSRHLPVHRHRGLDAARQAVAWALAGGSGRAL